MKKEVGLFFLFKGRGLPGEPGEPGVPYGHRGRLRAWWAAWPESSGSRWVEECAEWRRCQTAWTSPGSHWPLKAGGLKHHRRFLSSRRGRTLPCLALKIRTEAYSVTQLLKGAVCNGSTGFVQTHLPVVHIQNSRPGYCGQRVLISSRQCFLTDRCYYSGGFMKSALLSFCLKAICSNILSSVASAPGSLDLQTTAGQSTKD